MCTVTFLPTLNNNFILTSNRDEQRLRETDFPMKYFEDGVEMLFPKDKMAGGTWIGISDKKRLVCVLNGAFVKHKRKENYAKSRGVIAKEVLKSDDFLNFIKSLNLVNIEPFTMVIVDWNNNQLNLFELIWDDNKMHFNKLKSEAKIWSSSTLYSNEVKEVRKNWFNNWKENNKFSKETILNFHHSQLGDKEQSILMKRSYVETVSITSIEKNDSSIAMIYEDIIHSKKIEVKF